MIGKYFQSIGAFGVNQEDPVGTLIAYAENWRQENLAKESRIKALEERCKKLATMIPTSFTQCNGYKCREPHCISCNTEEDARAWLEETREYINERR